MSVCFIDTETRCRVPIERGTDLYTRSAECIIVTWAVDERPARGWDVLDEMTMPAELEDQIEDERVPLVAHQAPFDRNILRFALNKPTAIERWICTRAGAYAHGLPGSLETLGLVLGLPPDKQKLVEDGKLIQRFCVPRADGAFRSPYDFPEEWQRFFQYAIRDTEALREIFRKLPKHNYRGSNFELWGVDQHINERGFGFDRKLASAVVDFLKTAKERTDLELSKATGGAVQAATQRKRLLDYLAQKHDLLLSSLRAADVRALLEHDDLDPEVRFLLETRLEANKSAASKFARGLRNVGPGDRMRHTIQYGGAGRTGRFAGRGFQPHNASRPALTVRRENGRVEMTPVKAKYIDSVVIPGIYSRKALDNNLVFGGPNEAAALVVRHAIVAAPGNVLVAADWSNIESRVLAWIAGQEWKLRAYEEGADLYRMLIASFFGIKPEDVDDMLRQSGKVSELAFGFGGGVGALVTMAAAYQMDLDPIADIVLPRAKPEHLKKAYKAWRRAFLMNEDYALEPRVYQACDVLKQTYRESNDCINQMRYDLDKAIKSAIKTPGISFTVGKCKIAANSSYLIIELPSGRRLLYAAPRVETEVSVDTDTGKPVHREYVTYVTARGKSWRRERAWAGLFVENIVQAIANDVLRGALVRVHRDTLAVPVIAAYLETLPPEERTAISLHVHDEVVLDVPEGSYSLERLIEKLIEKEDWMTGLPLDAEGWIYPRYGKR